MSKNKNIKFTFGLKDWLLANRKACREIEIESGVFNKPRIHKSKKKYKRSRDKKITFHPINIIQ